MRAISLWQPWASLWCAGVKQHETRHWPTSYRGILLVHAALRKPQLYERAPDPFTDIVAREFGSAWAKYLPYGAIVGAVRLVRCQPTDREGWANEEDRLCGNWEPGRFAWKAVNFALLESPIPCRGRQSFFDAPVASPAVIPEIEHWPITRPVLL